MIILDSPPLIHLTKIGKINYIIDLFDAIIISPAVYNEVIRKGEKAGYSDAILLKNYFNNDKIKVLEVKTPDPILKEYLHPGEYESIQLALELDCFLIMDGKKGRKITEQKGIETLTTSDIILLLLKEKSIHFKLFRQNLSKYAADGRLGANIYQKYLREGKNYE